MKPHNPKSRLPKQAPKLMNFSRMRAIIEPHTHQLREHIFFNDELAVVYGDPVFFRLISLQKPPFTIDDHRMGIVVRGEIHANINLVEKHITAGTLVYIGPGSVISPISFSHDLEINGIGLSANFNMPFAPGQMPPALNGQVRDFQLSACEADITIARHIIDTIWHIVHQPDYNRQTVSALVAAQMHHYNSLYHQHIVQLQATLSHEQTIFNRFIYLVNQSATQHHQLTYYADRMCLSERYLGTIIRQASGVTAKGWIDRAIITRIKVELRHTDKSITDISEEMNFPTPSFFCKYFKRMTGQTPLEYRT